MTLAGLHNGGGNEGVRLIGMPQAFRHERIERIGEAGHTVAELFEVAMGLPLDAVPPGLARVTIGDQVIPRAIWHRVRPKSGTTVLFRIVPQNGNIFRLVLTLAVVVAAAYLGPIAAGAALGTTAAAATAAGGFAAFAFAGVSAAVTAGIAFAGNFLLNALVPIRPPTQSARSASPTYSIGGTRNTSNPWGPMPDLLGVHRIAPLYIARPYTEVVGSDQWLRVMFVWSYGRVTVDDMGIGTTAIGDFDDIEIEHREGLPDDPPTTLYPGQVFEEALSIFLEGGADWSVRRTEPDTDEISIDLSFPRGLFSVSKSGKKGNISSDTTVQMRKVDDADWVGVTTLNVMENKQEPFRRGYRWVVPRGQYDVRLQRTDSDSDTGTDRTEWSTLRSIKAGAPFTFAKPLCVTIVRIKAQDQLQGVIDTLNGIAKRWVLDWDLATGTWVSRISSNPASLYRHALQGPANPIPQTDAQINLAALQDWHGHCVALGLEFNMMRDFRASVRETLADIAGGGHATPHRPDGRWSVMVDRPKTDIIQHITPRNSWGMQSEIVPPDLPEAIRARFIDRESDWTQQERLVFREDVDPLTPDPDTEMMEFPGVTDPRRIWIDAQRRFRELRARAETYSVTQDWESLVVTRGDLVLAAHPVLGIGLAQGRVKAVSVAGTAVTVALDETVTMAAGKSYAIRFRRGDGSSLLRGVMTVAGETNAVRLVGLGAAPGEGDIFLFAEAGKDSKRLIVKAVSPGPKLTFPLTLVDEGPEIHEAETLTVPVWVPRQPQADADKPAVPRIIAVSSGNDAQTVGDDGSILDTVIVGLAPGGGGRPAAVGYEVRHRPAGSQAPWGTESSTAAAGAVRIFGYQAGQAIELQARAISGAGKVSDWTTPPTGHVVAGRSITPPDMATLTVTRLPNGMRQFAWTIADPDGSGTPPDLAGAVIRYRAGSGWGWADLNPLHTGVQASSPWETAQPGPAGTYTFGAVLRSRSNVDSATPKLITVALGPGITAPAPVITTASATIGNTNPTITGTAEPLATVQVYIDGTQVPGTVTADIAGNWSKALSGLAAGARTITATQTVNGGASGPSIGIVLTVQWNDPDAAGHVDFKANRGWLLGAATALTSIFDTITTSAQIVTMANGSLKSVAANTLPLSDQGLELWEARTNRCTNYNAAPTTAAPGNAGVTLSGDAAATLTMVSDATALAASKLAALVTAGVLSGTVYCLNNSAGTTDAFVTFGGTVTDTTAHRGFIWARGSAGRLEIGGVQIVAITAAGTTWTRFEGGRTPAVATEQMRVAAPAGATTYFIGNQLEKGAFATAPIVVAGTAATRNAPNIRHTLGADWNANEGFIGARASVVAGATNNGVVTQSLQPDGANTHAVQFLTTASIRATTLVANVAQAGPATAHTGGAVDQVVYGFKANDFAFAKGGAAPGTDVSGTVPTGTPALLQVGMNGTTNLNGIIEQVKWGTTKPSNAAIQAKSGWTLTA